MKKVGILGGAFDPPHIGHLRLAKAVFKELKLSELLIIPTADAPHKSENASFADRLAMCRAAFGDIEGFTVSDIEKDTGGKSYTVNTVRALREQYPAKTEFWLIIGSDQLFSFDKWYRYEAILKECRVAAADRGEDSYADMLEKANELGRIRVLNLPVTVASSTRARELVKNGGDTSGLLTPEVRAYIDERGLYLAG